MGADCSQANPEDLDLDIADYNSIPKQFSSAIRRQPIDAYTPIRGYEKLELIRLQAWLTKNNLLFQDKITSSLMPSQKEVSWLRLTSAFPGETYLSNNNGWQFDYNQDELSCVSIKEFKSAMLCLQNHPSLLDKICYDTTINNSGLYRFFFCLNGGRQKQIVIDDFIPVTKAGKYFFDSPRPFGGLWMILLQKALAKVVRSYEMIRKLRKDQILSEMTGYPCIQLYEPQQEKVYSELKIGPKGSKYFNIISAPERILKLILAFWFQLDLKLDIEEENKDLVMQLINLGESPKRIPLKKLESQCKNMVIFASPEGGFVQIDNSQAMVHIYNRSKNTVNCNLVVQANEKVHLPLINEPHLIRDRKKIKNQMINSEYREVHPKLIPLVTATYKLRIEWAGHRGVFNVKNLLETKQKFRFRILQDYKSFIHFEDQVDLMEKQSEVNPSSHFHYILNREKDEEYGNFYTLSAINLA